ncbi:YggS family pyridoxal phosphate-dependent enzyme [Rhodoluna sp.]|uniref:YggS family pyridoxal phosphate-dependent enzyme n=1 Tax=Rhodoluna sp. TaxID=1969481 RepID=UPI0025F0CF67|nr:YggS family pyridoxal phosphate-dependent enzyme [Rhodoluna sp.]
MASLAARYQGVLDRISQSAQSANRDAADLTLVVITKNHPASMVLELIELGARDFGENRDQEAEPKAAEIAQATSTPINWHFVGQLQTNKVKSALSYASTIHSLDRQSLLDSLAKNCLEKSEPLDVFVQLNLTDDPGRGGIEPKNLEAFANNVLSHSNLRLMGVMGVAALDRAPEVDFETIRGASEKLQQLEPGAKFISMGMSGDFETAIAFGATHLRIGSEIMGNRVY